MAKIAASKQIRDWFPGLPSLESNFPANYDCTIIHVDDWNEKYVRYRPMLRYVVVNSLEQAREWVAVFGVNNETGPVP